MDIDINDYNSLLNKIYDELPNKLMGRTRFEVPSVQVHVEGNKTIIHNFGQICEKIRRDPKILAKYLSKELASPVNIDGQRATIHRKLSSDVLNKKMKEFIDRYVICRECKRPDTRMKEIGHGIKQITCEACGARYTTQT